MTKALPNIYYSYYLFGLFEDLPIWSWEKWSKCIPILQSIIDLCPATPFIKTNQSIPVTYGKDHQLVSHNKGGVRFGRMIWNEKNNKKWTTKYANETNWTFFDTEIAFPTRSHCHKHPEIKPDLLIIINNENITAAEHPIVNQSITLHIGIHLVDDLILKQIEQTILALAKQLNVQLAGKLPRPSAYPSDLGIGYTHSCWDGSYGVLDNNRLDFSKHYKSYGIKKIRFS